MDSALGVTPQLELYLRAKTIHPPQPCVKLKSHFAVN